MLEAIKWLGEAISNLFVGADPSNKDGAIRNLFADVVVPSINMLGAAFSC